MIPQKSKPERETYTDKIYARPQVLLADHCAELRTWAAGADSGLHEGRRKHDLWRSSFLTTQLPFSSPIHSVLEPVWQNIIAHFGFDITFVEEYEIKCYRPGDFFESHTDNSFTITNDLDRKLTLSINLSASTDYEGGDLLVREVPVSREQGTATAFPTFFRHHVTPVTRGERWVLIGWAWGPYWR